MLKTLSDKRKNECQQCQNEHAKGHKVFEIKMISIVVHQHHPPFYVRIEVSHPATRLFPVHILPCRRCFFNRISQNSSQYSIIKVHCYLLFNSQKLPQCFFLFFASLRFSYFEINELFIALVKLFFPLF
ncbi:Uncharacterised protein [uncultured Blautia sp.]|nr:Uncharacterised protein [uncultured Blautia sp.]